VRALGGSATSFIFAKVRIIENYASRMTSADLLLHPVRLRIVKAFLGDRALTTAQLAAEIDDVPAGSLYRHVALLTGAGVLQVVAERRVRGATERTYSLRTLAARIRADEAAAMTAEEHSSAFVAYIAGMLADADRYLAGGTPDPQRDGADYRVGAMWLTDVEFAEFLRDLVAVLQPRFALAPGHGRRRRMVYGVVLPAPEQPPDVT
jgi:Helix-turn-helix domain